ncbi:MAG TPA: heparinase II/III family protein, partial [Candidatus Glassbacteria bacterium]|nr:heparinase II/III family protein [Candidatus Glassbacteria bacterium]
KLAEGARSCIQMYTGQGAHIFHTRMYGYPTGAGIAGLALAGHHPEADEFMHWAYDKYMDDLFPAREVQDGSVHNSMAYGRKYTMWLVGHFIAGWSSATGENLWQVIREEQGDWAWREALFLIYAEQPDGKLVRYGDNFSRGTERFSFRVVSERAFYYDEPAGRGYLNYILDRHKNGTDNRIGTEMGNAYEVFLYWDADDPSLDRNALPRRILFSPNGTGMAFWRTGWNPEDTFIFFKCGDYFDNHGHFDGGHVEIFRRAPLLIEGGTYAGGTDSDHYKMYFHNSVAHNTIQIADPSDPNDAGSQRYYNNQNMNTIQDYRKDASREYGNVIDYRDCGDDLAYLAAEFSAAYPEGRAKRVVRELVWTQGRWLVVVDNLTLAEPRYQPRILWHYTVKPQAAPKSFSVSDGGARAVVSVLAPAEAAMEQVEAFRVGDGVYPPRNPDPSLGVGRIETSVA